VLARLRHSGAVMAAANSAPPSAIDAAADAALAAVGLAPGGGPVGPPAAGSTPGGSEQLPLGLRNKQPHWNDSELLAQPLPVGQPMRAANRTVCCRIVKPCSS
jgi:hypothetical protein